MTDQKVDLSTSINRMNLAEQADIEAHDQEVTRSGNARGRTKLIDRLRNQFSDVVQKIKKHQVHAEQESKQITDVLDRVKLNRRTFLKVAGAGAVLSHLPRELDTPTLPSDKNEDERQNIEIENALFSQLSESARRFLIDLASATGRNRAIEEQLNIDYLSTLTIDELLNSLSEYYENEDLTTTPQEKLADHLRLHYLSTQAIFNIFNDESLTQIRENYSLGTQGDFITWFGTVFSAGEFSNILGEIVIDYQDERGRCIDGIRSDAVVWANKVPELFTRYFTSFFRAELSQAAISTDQDEETLRHSLWTQPNQQIIDVGFRAMIQALAYSDKFCSNANHASQETRIGLADTRSMLAQMYEEQFLEKYTLDNLHDLVNMSLADQIDEPLPHSPDVILDVFAYTATKNDQGEIDRSNPDAQFNARAVEFWRQYAAPNQSGTWLTLPEKIIMVTVSETPSAVTVAIGGETGSPIQAIASALQTTEPNDVHPAIRDDGLTVDSSMDRILAHSDFHLGRMMSKAYVQKYRRQQDLQQTITNGVNWGTLSDEELRNDLSRFHFNRAQLRMSEISPDMMKERLRELSAISSADARLSDLQSLFETARPSLQGTPDLGVLIRMNILFQQFSFAENLSDPEILAGIFSQEAMTPTRPLEFYAALEQNGLIDHSATEYVKFTGRSNSEPSPVYLPFSQLNLQQSFFGSGASRDSSMLSSIYFNAADNVESLGDLDEHFLQLTEHARWGVHFDTTNHEVHFYINDGHGVFTHFVISQTGVEEEQVTVTSDTFRSYFGNTTYFVGRPPKVSP